MLGVEDLWLGHSHDHSLGQRLVRFILYISFKMLMPIAFGCKPSQDSSDMMLFDGKGFQLVSWRGSVTELSDQRATHLICLSLRAVYWV